MAERTIKFLYVVREKYPTFRVDITDLFSRHLVPRGYAIDWVAQGEQGQSAGVRVIGFGERVIVGGGGSGETLLVRIKNQLAGLLLDLRLPALISAQAYDFVQVRDKFLGALVGLVAARRRRIPFFYWMSYPYPEHDLLNVRENAASLSSAQRIFYALRGHVTKWLAYRVILPRADHVFVQSNRMKEDVAAEGIPREKLTAVPMGISMERAHEVNSAFQDSRMQGRLPVVYVGTLVRIRRMDFLIDVFKRVHEREPRALLVLVGGADEPDMRFLRERAAEQGLSEHVIFTGFIPMEKAWGYVKAASVCVSPFRPSAVLDSCSPTKVVEYLAYGMPVVANDQPDQKLVLEESGAGLCVPYDEARFADAVLYLMQNPEIARAMAAKGPAYVDANRSYASLARALDGKYRQILDTLPNRAGAVTTSGVR